MCGLIGYMGRDELRLASVDKGLAALYHRGPDARGIMEWRTQSVACRIGHTRLRIVDLREQGDQPMSNEDRTVWVAFNGEIYNHPGLRTELSSAGHRFASLSDTEVLVHLYESVDGDVELMLQRLRGMFAFALWDQRRGRIIVGRDRLGIKPLYWSRTGTGLSFASEVRALVRSGLVKEDLDERCLGDFLVYGRIPGNSTPISHVRELPPGSYLSWDGDGPPPGTPTIWWRPARPPARSDSVDRDRVGDVLRDSIKRHIQADRPVGVFLSGGVDSSTVTALAVEAGATGALTVSWPEVGGDEAVAAREVAIRLGIEHHEVPFTGRELADILPSAIAAMDLPTSDGVNTWIVSRAARQAGYVVALSGLGGDELFGGYPSFRQVPRVAKANELLRVVPARTRVALSGSIGRRRPGGRWSRVLASERGLPGAYACVRSVFSPHGLTSHGVSLPFGPYLATGQVTRDPIDSVTSLESANYLPDQLLRDADQMSMAHSLELRVPLLDDEVVAAAFSLNAAERTQTLGMKSILRSVIPTAAGPKRTFTLPFDTWMRKELRSWLRKSLLSDELPLAREIPREFRSDLLAAFEARRTHWSRPWTVAVLRRYLESSGLGV